MKTKSIFGASGFATETGIEREFTATPLTQGSYVKALAQRTDEIERAAHRRGLRFARLSTSEPIDNGTVGTR